MANANAKVFFGGEPTDAQVKQLMEGIAPKKGATINYDEISKVCGEKIKTTRFKTIVLAWRRALRRERQLHSRAEAGVGVHIINEQEKASETARGVRGGARKVARAVALIGSVDTTSMNDTERARADHAQRLVLPLVTALRSTQRQLSAGPKGEPALPRLPPTGHVEASPMLAPGGDGVSTGLAPGNPHASTVAGPGRR